MAHKTKCKHTHHPKTVHIGNTMPMTGWSVLSWNVCHGYLNTSEYDQSVLINKMLRKCFLLAGTNVMKELNYKAAILQLNIWIRCTGLVWSLCQGHNIDQAHVPLTNFRLLFQDERHQQLTTKIWMRLVSMILFSYFSLRPVLAFGYCRCLRPSVCLCVCVFVCPSTPSLSAP